MPSVFGKLSLSRRLWLVLLLAIVPLAVLMLHDYRENRAKAVADIELRARLLVERVRVEEAAALRQVRQLLVSMARANDMAGLDPAACNALAQRLSTSVDDISNLGAVSADGKVFCSSLPDARPVDVSDRVWFQDVLTAPGLTPGQFVIGKMSGKPGITFGYPLRDEAGNFRAAVFAATNIRWFDRLTTSYQLPAGWTSVLFSADGGHSWQAAQDVPRSEVANKLNRVRVAPGGLAIATGEMGALLISRDFGQNWQRLREEEDVAWNDVAILDDGRLLVVGEFGRILLGDAQGQNWEEIASPVPASLMSVQFRDALNGVAVGLEGALLVTRDGGRQWDSVDLGINDHLFDVLWDAGNGRWFASGALGRWVSGSADGGWQSGALDERNLAWHTRALVDGADYWLAGADIGRWNGQHWSPLNP